MTQENMRSSDAQCNTKESRFYPWLKQAISDTHLRSNAICNNKMKTLLVLETTVGACLESFDRKFWR